MQFLHPGFLYFLFLLIIPIIVHFFQLRKFQKTSFTNVAFLKKVVSQTRKSAQLKKWLILFTRLLALTCIILAFAQPFFPTKKTAIQPKESVIYLDNSFSMQLEGKHGELLKRAIQELLKTIPPEKKFTLITNNKLYKNTSISQLKNKLMQLDYSSASPTLNTILLRAESAFSKNKRRTFIAISDFQENAVDVEALSPKVKDLVFIQLSPVNTNNVSIDSVFIAEKSLHNLSLTVLVSHTGESKKTVPISLYNGAELLAKTSVGFGEKPTSKVQLTLNNPSQIIRGKILIEDQGLTYDNSFYFSIDQPQKINIIALSETQEQSQFLKRIYNKELFNFLSFEKGAWDYNKIATANTVILNGLKKIPSALLPILSQIINNNGHLVVIPPAKNNLEGYQTMSLRLGIPSFSTFNTSQKKITEIAFAHPLYQHVFDSQVDNFQYPSVASSWKLQGHAENILTFSDGTPFLAQDRGVYFFTTSLNAKNSNFKQSPLIVPTFYNIAKQSLKLPKLYYTIGKEAEFSINTSLQKDEIVSLENKNYSFIPAQKSVDKKVQITTKTRPDLAGIYEVTKGNQVLHTIAYNYNRKESDLTYANLTQFDSLSLADNVNHFFSQQKEQNEIHELWKWFVIFALSFLLVELLLLKYLK